MWPNMFGPGWPWGVAVTLAVAALTVGWVVRVMRSEERRATSAGPTDDSWHRYEEGDLTRREFERLSRRRVA